MNIEYKKAGTSEITVSEKEQGNGRGRNDGQDLVRQQDLQPRRIDPIVVQTCELLIREAKGQEDFWRGYRTGLQTILNMNNDLLGS